MVIGALGVLLDLTVSQASTVIALRRANPMLGFRGLFHGAIEVGHDHIAATVNTLVFAYAGAAFRSCSSSASAARPSPTRSTAKPSPRR